MPRGSIFKHAALLYSETNTKASLESPPPFSMAITFFFLLSISISISLFGALIFLFSNKAKLPPGPPALPLLGNIQLLGKTTIQLQHAVRQLCNKYGPIITLYIGPNPTIFITSGAVAHRALIEKGSVFSDRPQPHEAARIIHSNQHSIISSAYGPVWRILRRNLASEALDPSRIKSYADVRKWALNLLIQRLRSHTQTSEPIHVLDCFQQAIFSMMLLMCFGQKLDDGIVKEIRATQWRLVLSSTGFGVFNVFPKIGKVILRKQWNDLLSIRRRQEELFIPLIRARKDRKNEVQDDGSLPFSYVDSLLTLQLPEEGGRRLTEGEMATLCWEFLSAGSHTTSTTIKEDDTKKMPYLKAVIMETLRQHPPFHFALPRAVSEDMVFEGYVIPKNTVVNFMVADMGWDRDIWEDPMEFRPERFLGGRGEEMDITGSKEIKMIPFGAGRRICPGIGLAMLHLEYFVANLVREFEWKVVDGGEVDLTEKQIFTWVMKNPLIACIVKRNNA